ncbi:1258_t:CDS:2 [Paraglomus brasilianum]|uniref:1258_t:CDS:1 n=1 Tax=Paraglomus brasilianum TaxID=144538 RepID=A0A9N8YWN2_9GLOM|nr:1258_t:CDS:2 [Paraglomus brasilianum]
MASKLAIVLIFMLAFCLFLHVDAIIIGILKVTVRGQGKASTQFRSIISRRRQEINFRLNGHFLDSILLIHILDFFTRTDKSDPYALVWVGGSKAFPVTQPAQTTKVASNTLNPVWNEDLYFCITNQTSVYVDVLDKNHPPSTPDNFIGLAAVRRIRKLSPAWFPLYGTKHGQIRLSMEFFPTKAAVGVA